MYKILTILVLSLSILNVNSQTASYEDVKSKKVKGLIGKYVTKDGRTIKVGDTISINNAFNNNTNFTSVTQASGMYPLLSTMGGGTVVIKKIKVSMKFVRVSCTSSENTTYPIYISSIENALERKEVSISGMNKEKAVEELKNQKDLLDLGIITEEEYNNKKIELLKYIKKG